LYVRLQDQVGFTVLVGTGTASISKRASSCSIEKISCCGLGVLGVSMIYSFLEFEFALVKTILARCTESARRTAEKDSRLSGAFAQKCSAQKSVTEYFTE